MKPALPRRDLAQAKAEAWQPPAFQCSLDARGRAINGLRRWADPAAHSIWLDLRRLLPKAEGPVLDVGCGAQPYRFLLAAGTAYQGLDIEEAESRFGYKAPGILYYDGGRWPFRSSSQGTVLCSEVLEHVLDPGALLAEAARCLRPGGLALFTVPFSARWHFIPHDYWRFTPSGLRHLFEGAGFEQVQVFARGNPLALACQKAMALVPHLALSPSPSLILRGSRIMLAALLSPAFVLLAILCRASLYWDWGEDCIGYTVLARNRAQGPKKKKAAR